MKFIDCHTHPCFNSRAFQIAANENKVTFNFSGYLKEMFGANIEKAIAIGVDIKSNRLIEKLSEDSDRIVPVMGVEKARLDACLNMARTGLRNKAFRGIKIFLGYDSFFPDSKSLQPFYKLAEKYEVPVIFHTGDTWANPKKYGLNEYEKKFFLKSKIKYAHPLRIDDVAVDHPAMKILVAHSGNPWVDDTAEIIFRNENCHTDISGWFVNSIDPHYEKIMKSKLNFLFSFAGPDKIMFGTDWPLMRMKPYTKFFMESGLKRKYAELIAYRNAEKFWK